MWVEIKTTNPNLNLNTIAIISKGSKTNQLNRAVLGIGTETHGTTIKDSNKIKVTLINQDNSMAEIKITIIGAIPIKALEITKWAKVMTKPFREEISSRITEPSIMRLTATTSHLAIKQDRVSPINHLVKTIQHRQGVIKIEEDSGTTFKTDPIKDTTTKIVTEVKEDIGRTSMISKATGHITITIDPEVTRPDMTGMIAPLIKAGIEAIETTVKAGPAIIITTIEIAHLFPKIFLKFKMFLFSPIIQSKSHNNISPLFPIPNH